MKSLEKQLIERLEELVIHWISKKNEWVISYIPCPEWNEWINKRYALEDEISVLKEQIEKEEKPDKDLIIEILKCKQNATTKAIIINDPDIVAQKILRLFNGESSQV